MSKCLKKILLLILCLGIFKPVAFASTVETGNDDENLAFAKQLGLISPDKDGQGIMTRLELAEVISRVVSFGNDFSGVYDIGDFTDVDISVSSKIMPAVNSGVMNGISRTEFNPSGKVSYAELMTAMVCLLGYKVDALYKGGYPNGYITKANELGIAPAMTSAMEGGVSYNALAYCLKAAVNTDVRYSPDGSDNTREEPFLEYYLNVYTQSGVVSSTGTVDLSGEGRVDFDEVRINGQIFTLSADVKEMSSLAGYDADIFYSKDSFDEYEILFFQLRKNKVFDIDGEKVEGIDGTKINYYNESDRRKSIRIEKSIAVVYNNDLCENYDDSVINPFSEPYVDGSVRLIDNNDDNMYDIIFIDAFECFVVDNAASGRIYNKYRKPEVLDLSDYDPESGDYAIMNILGEYLKFEDIEEGDILSVQRNLKGEVKLITVSVDTYTGTVTEFSRSDNEYYLTVDGTEFKCSSCMSMNEQIKELRVGNKVLLYFNKLGRVSDIECEDYIKYKIGYIVWAYTDDDDEDYAALRVFTSAGSFSKYDIAKRVTVNDISSVKSRDVLKAIGRENSGMIVRQPIKYLLNENNEIKSISFFTGSTDSTKDGFYRFKDFDGVSSLSTMYYRQNSGSVDAKMLMSDKTVIFSVPTEEYRGEDTMYSVENKNYFPSDYMNTPIEAFGTKANNPRAEIVIIKKDKFEVGTSERELYRANPDVLVVDNVSRKLYNDEIVCEITGYYAGKLTSYAASLDAVNEAAGGDLKRGDIIRFYRNNEGVITIFQRLFEGDELIMNVTNPTTDSIYAFARFAYGDVVYADDECISVKIDGTDSVESYLLSPFNKVLYDKSRDEKEQLSPGNAEDIRSCSDFGLNGSKVFIHTYNADNRTLVIINE